MFYCNTPFANAVAAFEGHDASKLCAARVRGPARRACCMPRCDIDACAARRACGATGIAANRDARLGHRLDTCDAEFKS